MNKLKKMEAKEVFGLFMVLIIDMIICAILIPGMYALWIRMTPPLFSFITLFCVVVFYKMIMNRLNEFLYHMFVRPEKNGSRDVENIILPKFSDCLTFVSCFILYWGVFWIVCDLAELISVILLSIILDYVANRKKAIVNALKRILSCKTKTAFLFFACILLIGLSYYIRCDKTFQRDSEDLVNSIIVAKKMNLSIEKAGYGLGHLTANEYQESDSYMINSNPDLLRDGYSFKPYKSQLGLQGYIFGGLSALFGNNALGIMQMICCMLLASIIILISYEISKRYNTLLAISFFSVSVIAGWIVKFSSNLYWLEFSWFLPLLLSLLLLNYRKYKQLIYICYFITILARCLCGYEYISTIMFGGITFLIIEALIESKGKKEYLSMIVIVGTLSLLAFGVVFLTHVYIYGGGNVTDGIRLFVRDVVERRTFGNSQYYDFAYSESLSASIGDVLIKYFFKGTGKEISILTVISIICIMMNKKERLQKMILLSISIMGPLSWFVLGKAHSHAHPHLNYVLWYLGYVQSVVYIIMDLIYHNKSMIRNTVNREI